MTGKQLRANDYVQTITGGYGSSASAPMLPAVAILTDVPSGR
jgi:hypothetical protein